ncbi:MAG TPA: transglycosylase SLT domain-containing protein [Geobacteraceae bacterium]
MRSFVVICIALVTALPALAAPRPDLLSTPAGAELRQTRGSEAVQHELLSSLVREPGQTNDTGVNGPEVLPLEEITAEPELELELPREELPDSDIPLTLNAKVDYFIRYFQGPGRTAFSRWLSRSERYIPMMREVLKKAGLPEDLVYVAMIESGFTPHAYSVAAAVGPWQFMSATGRNYALRIDGWIDERRDPLKSSVAAALYLKELYGIFNKDWYLAAAGYNAGENKILRAIDRYNSTDFWELAKGSYLARETKDYVPKLLAAAIIAKEPAKYGFADVAYLPPIEFDTVTIPAQTDLELVARLCGVSYETIRELNPELRRWATPPDYPGYQLKLPKGHRERFETEYAKVPEEKRYTERTVHVRYRVRRGETLSQLARRFGTTPEEIATRNRLGKHPKLRGKVLVIAAKAALLDSGEGKKPLAMAKSHRDGKAFTKYYTVKRGDTLPSLARRFNVSTRLLAVWNNLKGKMTLQAGRRIIVARYVEKKGAMTPVTEKS